MTHQVAFTPSAARQLRELDPPTRRRIQAVIDLLADQPRPPAATQLVGGSGEWRVRTGDCRIVWGIVDDELLILVHDLGHRREVYQPR